MNMFYVFIVFLKKTQNKVGMVVAKAVIPTLGRLRREECTFDFKQANP